MIIVRYAEIGIKGKNRIIFEKKLVSNIKAYLKDNNIEHSAVKRVPGRIIIETDQDCKGLDCIFGISSFSKAAVTGAAIEDIKHKIKTEFLHIIRDGFRVTCKKGSHRLGFSSQKIAEELGEFIQNETGFKVMLKNSKYELSVEFRRDKVYIFDNFCKGFGGLPVGIEGIVAVILNSKEDLVAMLKMLKRGCGVYVVLDGFLLPDWMKVYYSGFKIKEFEKKDLARLPNYVRAIVVGQNFESFKKIKTELEVLRPNMGANDGEIEECYNKYMRSAKMMLSAKMM